MEAATRILVAYLLNSFWQISVIAALRALVLDLRAAGAGTPAAHPLGLVPGSQLACSCGDGRNASWRSRTSG